MKPRCCALVAAAFTTLMALPGLAYAETAYFSIINRGVRTAPQEFIMAVTDPATIQTLRREVTTGDVPTPMVLNGLIERGRVPYNPDWNFHYLPDTVRLVTATTEGCDAAITYVEDNIELIGTDFLPGQRWCPWNARVIREVNPILD